MRKSVLIIGLGRLGRALAQALFEAEVELIALDLDEDSVADLKDRTSAAFVGDATSPDVLRSVDPKNCDACVVTFGQNFEATVLTVSTLVQEGAKHVVARAGSMRQAEILLTIGAHRVIQPESDTGRRLANELITPAQSQVHDLVSHYQILPWQISAKAVGQTVSALNLYQKYEVLAVGLQSSGEDSKPPDFRLPAPQHRLQEDDTLLLVGEEGAITHLLEDLVE